MKRFKRFLLRWIHKSPLLHFRTPYLSWEKCMICTGNVTWGNVIGGGLSYITHWLLLLPFASGVSLRASAPYRADGNTNTSKSLFILQISVHMLYIRTSALLLLDVWYTYIVRGIFCRENVLWLDSMSISPHCFTLCSNAYVDFVWTVTNADLD